MTVVINEYIVSARKYRPASFGTLIGQDNIARTLSNAISRGSLAHAYLFCGPRGVGKTTTARIFAKMINCEHPLPGGEPCGECESCRSFAENRSYCIFEMDAASNNSVDDIKELIDKVRIPPQTGKYSVYIIDEVHMLSQQAFNAFLKTLEEPPEYAIFILATTEKHKILPTILSRCQTYDFNRISVSDIVRNLRGIATKEGVDVDDESLHVIALKADGAMRDALTIFDQSVAFCGNVIRYEDIIRNLNVLDYEYTFRLVDNFLAGDYATALRSFDEILAKGFNALHFVSSLSSHLRNLIVSKVGGADSLLELADSVKTRYSAQAAQCSEKFLYDALSTTMACEQGYRAAVNQRLHIEFCLMRLCFLQRQPSSAAPAAPATPVAPAASAPLQAASHLPGLEEGLRVETPAPLQAASHLPGPEEGSRVEAPASHLSGPEEGSRVEATAPHLPGPEGESRAEAPAPRRRENAGASLGLSLSSLGKESQEDNAAKAAEETVAEKTPEVPSDDAILKAWDALCEASRPNQRLYTALETAKKEIIAGEGKKTVRYYVLNDALKQWLGGINTRIENKFRELCASRLVDIQVDVVPEDPSQKVVASAEDKAKEMIDKNPDVGTIVTQLGLELK